MALLSIPNNISKPLPMIDIGSNLTSLVFGNDISGVMNRAYDAGVTGQIITGTNYSNSRDAIELAKSYRGASKLWTTFGIHPHNAAEWRKWMFHDIMYFLGANGNPLIIKAVGETGLDYYRNKCAHDLQRYSFGGHLEIAWRLKLPVFCHIRNAFNDFKNIVLDFRKKHNGEFPALVVHCFTGTRADLQWCIKEGFYIGITGYIDMKIRGADLRSWITRELPLNRLMIETDAPYMMPERVPVIERKLGPRNCEPAHIKYIVAALAECYTTTEPIIRKHAYNNTVKFFNLS